MAKVLNIEICDRTISVCRTARKGKGVRLFDSFVFPTPEDCVLDGVILNPKLLANELKLQLASYKIKQPKNVIFSVSSSRIAVREIKFPPIKEKLLSEAIHTNSADYFPINLKDYHITYYILEKASSAIPNNRVLVMAVPISMIEGYFQLAEMAGLSIRAIDSSGNSQYQILRKLKTDGVTVFADVGSSSSILSFMRGGELLLQRTFAFGADELIEHFGTECGIPGADYMRFLHETDITNPGFSADKVLTSDAIQNDLERLVGSIARSIDYFNLDQLDAAVTRVVLVGLNRHIVGLKDMVAESTGLETLYLDEISDFAQLTSNSPCAAALVNCIGSTIASLDLIPKQLLPSRGITVNNDDASLTPGVVICALIIAGAVLVSLSSWFSYKSAADDLAVLQAEISSVQSASLIYAKDTAFQQSEKAFDSYILSTDTQNVKLVGFFEELEQQMPSSILLMSASCTNDGITLNITVGSYTEAASIISTLRGFESIATVEISSLTRDSSTGRVSFTVNCTYGTNPYLNGINPYGELIGTAEGDAEPAASADPATQTETNSGIDTPDASTSQQTSSSSDVPAA